MFFSVELIAELILDLIVDGYSYLMEMIIPKKLIGRKSRIILKIFVFIESLLMFMTIFFGVFALISDDEYTKMIGRRMVFIPLAIILVQILFGGVIRIVTRKRK